MALFSDPSKLNDDIFIHIFNEINLFDKHYTFTISGNSLIYKINKSSIDLSVTFRDQLLFNIKKLCFNDDIYTGISGSYIFPCKNQINSIIDSIDTIEVHLTFLKLEIDDIVIRSRPTHQNKIVKMKTIIDDIKNDVFNNNLSEQSLSVVYVTDPLKFISNGLFPNFNTGIDIRYIRYGALGAVNLGTENSGKLLLKDLLNGITSEEVKFWYDIKKVFQECTKWIYGTLNYFIRTSLPIGDSLPMLLFYPDQVYSDTLHPKTDMSLYRQPIQKQSDKLSMIPVVRYSAGMRRGLFHEECNNCCGTYYYLEPESKTFLGYNTSLTFKNKSEAYINLIGHEGEVNSIIHERNLFNDDLMYTPLEIYLLFMSNPILSSYIKKFNLEDVRRLPQKKRYLGVWLNLYANEDELDDDLCKVSQQKGIDILIFTHMTGSHQVVSELVDTRDRIKSFENLIYT